MSSDSDPVVDAYARERRLAGDILGYGLDLASGTVTFLVDAERPEPELPATLAGFTVRVIAIRRPQPHGEHGVREHAASHLSDIHAYAWERRMADELLAYRVDEDGALVTFVVAAGRPVPPYPAEIFGYRVAVLVDPRDRLSKRHL